MRRKGVWVWQNVMTGLLAAARVFGACGSDRCGIGGSQLFMGVGWCDE